MIKKSGQIVETYGEIIEETELLAKSTGTNSIVTTYTERTDGPSINRIVSRLTVKMNIFTSGSFRQINSVLSTSLATVNSNFSTIEDIDTVVIPSSSDFPSTGISANGTGVVTTKATFSTKLELEAAISKYKEVNFAITLSGGVSFDFYARKSIDLALNYSLY